jgi:hypothetical protein
VFELNIHRRVRETITLLLVAATAIAFAAGQTRRRRSTSRPNNTQAAPRGSAAKYSSFLHSSEKHKSLKCNACHNIPTNWNAKREFPDVADFPDHDACVRCHRQQFFTRQAMVGTGPVICATCHVRAAPREAARFAFGKPNNANQVLKPKDERQFTIEFPHDKHQNVIAFWSAPAERSGDGALDIVWSSAFRRPNADGDSRVNAELQTKAPSLLRSAGALHMESHHRLKLRDDRKTDYNNCTICHQRNDELLSPPSLSAPADASTAANKFFKTMPHSHDSCFACHWKNQEPVSSDCIGCHKPANPFVASAAAKRISAKFNHEGGKGEHVLECTSCHINITRATTVRGLTPDVPIAACTTCHQDSKKTTYPKAVTIEEELTQFKRTNVCTYCHTADVGTKRPPASHEAAAQ